MSEVNRITNVENKNVYNINSDKRTAGPSASFSSYLGETKSLDSIFSEASEKYKVPVNLLKAIGKQESGFDSKAVSRCGAQGIMQLMPATAASLGVTDSFDAEQNIMGGAKYISQLLDKYDGNSSLALAAYNAGSNNVAKYGGIPPFKETQDYVKKVLGYMNQGVDTNNAVVTTGSFSASGAVTNSPINIQEIKDNIINRSDLLEENSTDQDLDSFFSYDDYLKFIDIFFKEDDRKEQKDYYTANTINMNGPVLNLLKIKG
ncbi:lytic transglycosylase domain-containing protein [Anaerocolumna sp. AGMB13025]|uniref:lytic transglycosylase domain-containing protein n=1 Tax=Anaerocolumna sp. AGMB13025 TaxID=3039116 RepID=UPI00241E2563|nr:lytic transglycosylase domain-containing protein [Anaerocolumna sp. AGMB13025]WFR58448.1 lytic transglycosylase domain-containing protein [Anaerocolumna sp. AGMB13025]